jgi:deoxyribose-phosphate aldolase
MLDVTYDQIAKMIDHSLVNPTLTVEQLEAGLQLALAYNVASVSIMPYYMARCAEALAGSDVHPGATVGFPHGSHTTAIKAAEASQAIADGALELDMVCNISKVLSGDWAYVQSDVHAVAEIAHSGGGKLKVIFENCYLNDTQKIRLCEVCGEAGANWLKTSTGFATAGCTMQDLSLMIRHAPPGVQVKAAGGIRDFDTLLRVKMMGVTRVGATRTASMLDECRRRLNLAPTGFEAPAVSGAY